MISFAWGRIAHALIPASVLVGLAAAAGAQDQPVAVAGNAANAALTAGITGEEAPQGAVRPSPRGIQPLAATPAIDSRFIVFGYVQNDAIAYHIRWNALTHVATEFCTFDGSGNLTTTGLTGRNAELKAGGGAQAAGVKVIMLVANDDLSSNPAPHIASVMQSGANRTTLINNIVAAVTADSYCQGVSLDLEGFSYGSLTRDGITAFFSELRSALGSSYELSLYTNSSYSSSNYDIPGLNASLDYYLYSCYDWATSGSAHAISDFNNYIPFVSGNGAASFMQAGVPADKMVMVISAYSRRWAGATTYNTAGSATSQGFCTALWDTTLNTATGPATSNYVTGDEVGYYTWNPGTITTATWDNEESMEYKIRQALSVQDATGAHNGLRLRGVGFWSLYWFANFTSSRNPISGVTSSYTRTYPQIYELTQEILHTPGQTRFVFDKFENLNQRWRDFIAGFNSPDNTNLDTGSSTRSIVISPGGAGAPPSTTNGMDLHFVFTGTPAKCFFRHEVLNDNTLTSVTDTNAVDAKFDINNTVNAYVYNSGSALTGITVRLVVMDANRQLEASPAYPITTANSWNFLSWDLSSGASTGLTTAEPAFLSGNNTINTAPGGARDISFIGFLVERSGGSSSGDLIFDELSYEHVNPGGKDYKINEFRYNGTGSTGGGEFVEIFGPSGAFPTNTQLRFYDSTDGSVLSSVNLGGQSVPADGHFVIGDNLGIGNVDLVPGGWSTSTDDIPDAQPSAIQIYNTSTGCVYDSVTYKAMGGLADLIRQQTHGVTGESYAWCGEQGPGTNAAGAGYALGRYPDGADTNVNENDFSSVPATPGTANGGSVALGSTFDFSSTPSVLFQTYDLIDGSHILDPTSAGLPASPNLGNAWRCVDTAGGGVVGVLGDPALGSAGDGYTVTGQLYVPAGAAPAQAVAVGICGRQGSTFFTNFPDNSGYESGYWLLYENAAVGLDNGAIPDNVGKFQALWARNDRMQSASTTPLGTPLTVAGGQWVTFSLTVNPNLDPAQGLIFTVNGSDVYRGSIPSGGPISGAFQVGFRENHAGGPAAAEGTWIDNLAFGGAVPVGLSLLGAD